MGKLLMWQGIRGRAMGWTEELQWASMYANSGSTAADLYRLSLACCIYALWHERTVLIFQNQKTEINILLRRAVQEIHNRGTIYSRLKRILESLKITILSLF